MRQLSKSKYPLNECLISFVLPCFNVASYIDQCLNSIYNQNLSDLAFEVICVNDCSTDNTELIIKKHQSKHLNLFIINNNKNLKAGASRNSGFSSSRGRYVWFVDPDDFLNINCLNRIFDLLFEFDPDILQFNANRVDVNGKFSGKRYRDFPDKLINGEKYIAQMNWEDFPIESWSKIFRSKFLKEANILYPEVAYGEDDHHSIEAFLKAEVLVLKNIFPYNYRCRPLSIMNSNELLASRVFEKTLILGSKFIMLSEYTNISDVNVKDKLLEAGRWRLNKFLRPLMKMSIAERRMFFILLKTNSKLPIQFSYFNTLNGFFIKHRKISQMFFYFTNIYYRNKNIYFN